MKIDRADEAKKLTKISLGTNIVLASLKVISGIVGHSSVIIADGIDSFSDVISTLLAFFGVTLAEKEADEEHPYGHERFEGVFGKIMAMFIFLIAAGVFLSAVKEIQNPEKAIPSMFPLLVAILSIVGKIILSRYTLTVAKKIQSNVFEADAKNFMNDSLSSAGALLGIYLAQKGYPIFQPIFSMVIGIFILRVGIDLYRRSLGDLIDRSADEDVLKKIREKILKVEGVRSIDVLRTRMHGRRIYVDLEIGVNKESSLIYAHEVAENVHDSVEEISAVKHCMVHVNPR